jgi:DNA modification methylase
MTETFTDSWLTIREGDCRVELAAMDAASVHTVITSPPYYNLRDYGHADQIGLEPNPSDYIWHMVEVGRHIRRVLRDDGIFWLNLGDSYGANWRGGGSDTASQKQLSNRGTVEFMGRSSFGLTPKTLLGMPWRVAFALQDDGWILRRDIVWSKPNPMPESVSDRPTTSHEYIFMLTKKKEYFYDAFAVREPVSQPMAAAITRGKPNWQLQHDPDNSIGGYSIGSVPDPSPTSGVGIGRSRRSVWTIPTVTYPGAHYATFPPKLVEPMIQAATSEHGVCEECGAPYQRIVETQSIDHHITTADGKTMTGPYAAQADIRNGAYSDVQSKGWKRPCAHDAKIVPATVLDPFAGSGTVGMVANKLSRRAVLIDINAEYVAQQLERTVEIPLGL